MTAPERTRFPTLSVPESEVLDWYNCGWTYLRPDEARPDHMVMRWDQDKPPVAPFRDDDAQHLKAINGVSA